MIWNYHKKNCWAVIVRSNSHVVLKNKNSRKNKFLSKLVRVSWLLGKLDFCSHSKQNPVTSSNKEAKRKKQFKRNTWLGIK